MTRLPNLVWCFLVSVAAATTGGATLNCQTWMDNIHEVAVSPDGKELWACGVESPYIAIIDIESSRPAVVGEVVLPGLRRPHSHIVFSSDGRFAYLVNSLEDFYEASGSTFGDLNYVIVIDVASRNVISRIPLDWPYSPSGSLVIGPDGEILYITVADYAGGRQGICRLNLKNGINEGFLEVSGVNFITLSPDGKRIYATRGGYLSGFSPDLFSSIALSGFELLSSVSVGSKPRYVAITPDGTKAYVTCQTSDSVSIVNLATFSQTKTIKVGSEPDGIVLTPDGTKAYVGNAGSADAYQFGNSISVIDVGRDLLTTNIVVGLEPLSLAMRPDGTKVYVSDGNANGLQPAEVYVIDAENDTALESIIIRDAARCTPTGLDVTPDGKRAFVISEAARKLLVVDMETRQIVRGLSVSPRGVKVSDDGQSVFVFCPHYGTNNDGVLMVVDADSLEVLNSIALGDTLTQNYWEAVADRIVIDSDGNTAYITCGDSIQVLVVDLVSRRVVSRIPVGTGHEGDNMPARGLAITPDDAQLFVSDGVSDRVAVIDTATRQVVNTVAVGNCPSEIEVSADGTKVYVLNQSSTVLMTILDAGTHATIKTLNFPIAAALDFVLSPDESCVYIACFDPNWIMLNDLQGGDNRFRTLLKTGLDPFNLAVNRDKTRLYVSHFTSDTIAIVDIEQNQVIDTIALDLTGLTSAPTGVSATKGGCSDRVRVSWETVSNASAYEVWRHMSTNTGAASKISSPDPTGTNYDDTSAMAGTTYYYWVKAVNAAGASSFSAYDTGWRASANFCADIDGDGLADLITVVESNWYVWFSTSQYLVRCGPYDLGISGTPATGDIDGDGLADLVSVVGSSWYVWFSTSQYLVRSGPYDMGISGTPTNGDIDGDRLADLIVVVGSDWYVWFSTSQYLVRGGPYTLSAP